MKLEFTKLPLDGAYIIKPIAYEDQRGSFERVFCQDEFKSTGLETNVKQINYSSTVKKGTIRGLHYQKPPSSEIKMVKCISGSVIDVIIDLRKDSKTFLKWHAEILTSSNRHMMYVPKGFAHGIQSLEDNSEIIYFNTEFYNPELESGIRYNDPVINIKWPLEVTDISTKDNLFPFIGHGFKGISLSS